MLIVAGVAAGLTAAFTLTGRAEPEIMGSRAVAWETLKAEPTKVGEVRHVFQAPTATLDELESHITTLNPGQVPHAPHKHPDEEVLCLKEGTLEAYIGGETTRVGTGQRAVLRVEPAPRREERRHDAGDVLHREVEFPGMLKKKNDRRMRDEGL